MGAIKTPIEGKVTNVTPKLWEMSDMVAMLEAWEAAKKSA